MNDDYTNIKNNPVNYPLFWSLQHYCTYTRYDTQSTATPNPCIIEPINTVYLMKVGVHIL